MRVFVSQIVNKFKMEKKEEDEEKKDKGKKSKKLRIIKEFVKEEFKEIKKEEENLEEESEENEEIEEDFSEEFSAPVRRNFTPKQERTESIEERTENAPAPTGTEEIGRASCRERV